MCFALGSRVSRQLLFFWHLAGRSACSLRHCKVCSRTFVLSLNLATCRCPFSSNRVVQDADKTPSELSLFRWDQLVPVLTIPGTSPPDPHGTWQTAQTTCFASRTTRRSRSRIGMLVRRPRGHVFKSHRNSPLTRELVDRLRAALQRCLRKPWHADLMSAVPTQNRTAECTPLPFECPVHQPARRVFRAGSDERTQSKDCTMLKVKRQFKRVATLAQSELISLPCVQAACLCLWSVLFKQLVPD